MPPIELYGADAAGHLMLLPDGAPEPASGGPGAVPPPGEPPLPSAAPTPEAEGSAPADTSPEASVELAALRRLIEEREQARAVTEAQRDAEVRTLTRVLRGEEQPQTPAAPASPPQRPTAEAFESHEAYVEALVDWKAEARLSTFRQEHQQAAQAAAQAAAQQQWQSSREAAMREAEAAFTQAHPDYQARVTAALAGKLAPHLHTALMLFDEAPVIAYAMAQDAALVERLNAMPPPQLLYALGRLSAQHGGREPPPGATAGVPVAEAGGRPPAGVVPGVPVREGRSKPPPPRPLSGTGVAPVGGYADSMSQAEYRQWRKQNAT